MNHSHPLFIYWHIWHILWNSLTGCNAACTAQKCKKTWVNATSVWTNDSWNAGGQTVGEGAAFVFSSEGERDAHPPAGSAAGCPLWATMTCWEDEDLHHSLMNLWCRKWKQPLAGSSGACGALEMGGKTGPETKKCQRLCNYWGAARMKVIILVTPLCMCRRRTFYIYNATWTWLWGRRETKIDHLIKYSVTFWGYF